MDQTPPHLPPQILDNLDSFRTAVAITRSVLLSDGESISGLWLNLTQGEQLKSMIAAGHMINELTADHYVLKGQFEQNGVPLAVMANHYDQLLTELATADGAHKPENGA